MSGPRMVSPGHVWELPLPTKVLVWDDPGLGSGKFCVWSLPVWGRALGCRPVWIQVPLSEGLCEGSMGRFPQFPHGVSKVDTPLFLKAVGAQ